jgi:hypothetical protein
MPRKSAAALATPLLPDKPRLKPPADLPELEKRAFLEIVASVRPEHFGLEDVPLVAAYAGLIVEERLTRIEGAKARANGDTKEEGQWAQRHARACQTMVVMVRTLRLGPKSRYGSNARRRDGQALSPGQQTWAGKEEMSRSDDWRPWQQ